MTWTFKCQKCSSIPSYLAHHSCLCLINLKPSKLLKVSTYLISEHLSKNGKIYFLLTLYDEKTQFNRFMEVVKPYLKYLTTVDFGKVTYKSDFESFLDAKGLECSLK